MVVSLLATPEHAVGSISNSGAKPVGVSGVWANNFTPVTITHQGLSRMRNDNWEPELRWLANDDGARNSRRYG